MLVTSPFVSSEEMLGANPPSTFTQRLLGSVALAVRTRAASPWGCRVPVGPWLLVGAWLRGDGCLKQDAEGLQRTGVSSREGLLQCLGSLVPSPGSHRDVSPRRGSAQPLPMPPREDQRGLL